MEQVLYHCAISYPQPSYFFPSWPWTHFIAHAGNLSSFCLSPPCLKLQACATRPGSIRILQWWKLFRNKIRIFRDESICLFLFRHQVDIWWAYWKITYYLFTTYYLSNVDLMWWFFRSKPLYLFFFFKVLVSGVPHCQMLQVIAIAHGYPPELDGKFLLLMTSDAGSRRLNLGSINMSLFGTWHRIKYIFDTQEMFAGECASLSHWWQQGLWCLSHGTPGWK